MDNNIITIITTAVVSIVGALGGWESVKYLINRKTNRRKEEADADLLEFHALTEVVKGLQESMAQQEERYNSQTQRLRQAQDELFEVNAKYHSLKTLADLKICEKRGCAMREPQTGY